MRLWIRGDINEHTATAFAAAVEACEDEEIEVLIDSAGGLCTAAFSMAAALVRSEVPSTGILLQANSAALFAAIGCDKRIAARDASVLLHDVTLTISEAADVMASDMHAAAEHVEQWQRTTERVLALKTGTPAGLWRLLMGANTTLNAADMLRHGIVSEISRWPRSHFVDERSDDWIQRFADITAATLLRAKNSVAVGFSSELLAGMAATSRSTLRNVQRFGYRGTAIEAMAQRQVDSAEAALRRTPC